MISSLLYVICMIMISMCNMPALYGMEKWHAPETLCRMPLKDYIDMLDGADITNLIAYNNIFEVSISRDPSVIVMHCLNYNNHSVPLLFSPVDADFSSKQDPDTISIKQYSLFNISHQQRYLYAACMGATELMNHIEPTYVTDKSFKGIAFTINKRNGSALQKQDVINTLMGHARIGKTKLLKWNKPLCASNTYTWPVIEIAQYYNQPEVVQLLCQKIIDRGQRTPEILNQLRQAEAEISEKKKQNTLILKAIEEKTIPTFAIDEISLKKLKSLPNNFSIESTFDSNLIIHVADDNQRVYICTEPNKNSFDLDSLATLYAYLICFNSKIGHDIVQRSPAWSKFSCLKDSVLSYINFEVEDQLHLNSRLMINNLLALIQKLPLHSLSAKNNNFMAAMLRYLHSNMDNGNYRDSYNTLVERMLSNEQTKKILRYLCVVQPQFFNRTIKPYLKKDLASYVLRKILKSGPETECNQVGIYSLPIPLIELIIKYCDGDIAIQFT